MKIYDELLKKFEQANAAYDANRTDENYQLLWYAMDSFKEILTNHDRIYYRDLFESIAAAGNAHTGLTHQQLVQKYEQFNIE